MPHLNELAKKYASKGLFVMSGSSQAKGTIEPWLESKGVEFPIFIDDGGQTSRAYGVKGIPHCALVGPDGKIAYKGHPGSLKDALIEKVLAKVVLRFGFTFPSAFRSVEAKIKKKDFSGALKALAKVEDKDTNFAAKVRADIIGYAADMRKMAETDAEAGDYLSAMNTLARVVKQFKGTEPGKELDALLKQWKKDPTVKKELKANKILAKARGLEKKFFFKAAMGLYRSVAKKFEGTKSGDKAKVCFDKIKDGALWKINPKCKACKKSRAPCPKHS